MNVSASSVYRALLFASIILVSLGGFVLHAHVPVGDNAMFEFGGRAIVDGRMLYRDVWDNKLPGVFLINALWWRLSGGSYAWHAAAEILFIVGISILVGVVTRGFGCTRALFATALSALMLCVVSPQINTTETYALLPILFAIASAQRGRGILSGVSVAIATMFWIPSILIVGMLAVYRPVLIRSIVLALICGLLSGAVIFIATFGLNESSGLVRSWVEYISSNASDDGIHVDEKFRSVKVGLESSGIGVLLVLIVGRRIDFPQRRIVFAWMTASFLGTLIGWRFYNHYFIPSIPPLVFALVCSRPHRALFAKGAIAIAALLVSIPTTRFIVSNQSEWIERARNVRKTGEIVRRFYPGRVTIAVDAYAPEVYLELEPELRFPHEIVAIAVTGTVTNSRTSGFPRADAVVLTNSQSVAPPDMRSVSERLSTWRVFVRSRRASEQQDRPSIVPSTLR